MKTMEKQEKGKYIGAVISKCCGAPVYDGKGIHSDICSECGQSTTIIHKDGMFPINPS